MSVPAVDRLEACAECGHARGWHTSGVCHATVLERVAERRPGMGGMNAHTCRCSGFVPAGHTAADPLQRISARDARAYQDAGLRGDLAPDAVFEALIAELEVRDEALTVELDPSVADWTPDCWQCGNKIDSWAEAVALPASPYEDDEPTGVVFLHKRNCSPE